MNASDPTIVSAAIGLVGALVGGAISGGVTWLLAIQRWKREDRTRFHVVRLEAYAEFSSISAKILAVAQDIESLSGLDVPEMVGFRVKLAEDMHKWAALRQRVGFLGSTELLIVATKIGEFIKAAAREDAPNRDDLVREGANLIGQFVEHGRAEFGDPLKPVSQEKLKAMPTSPLIRR